MMNELAQKLHDKAVAIGLRSDDAMIQHDDLERFKKLFEQASQALESKDHSLQHIRDWCQAYPVDVFTPLRGDPVKRTGDYDTDEKRNLITRASASMGRHMAEGIASIAEDGLSADGTEDWLDAAQPERSQK